MPTTTLSPANTYNTPHYKKSLPTLNGVLVPAGTPNATDVATFAMLVGGANASNTNVTVKDQDFVSNNNPGGITFMGFNRASKIENVNVNLGPNSSGNRDFGDTIMIDSEKSKPVNIINSSFVTGNQANSPANDDKDLIVFGSDKFNDTAANKSFLGIAGLIVSNTTEVDVVGSTVSMGNDNDTIVLASTNASSIIQNNNFNLGDGADYIYFNRTQSILGGNTIRLSDTPVGDAQKDTITFATNNLSGVNGINTKLTILNFEDSIDSLAIVGGATYTTKSQINAVFGSKISFT